MRGLRSMVLVAVAALALATTAPVVTAQDKTPKPKANQTATTPVNLNTATAAELQALPGVGAATAKLILEYRQKNGSFKKIEELMTIKGIGEKSFLKLKPLVTIAADKERHEADGRSR